MSDDVENLRTALRQRADKIEQQARQQISHADVALKHADKDDPAQARITASRKAVIGIGEQIDALKSKISAEREPVRESLLLAQQAVTETEAEVKRLALQIEDKEREIENLVKTLSRREAGLGEIMIPDSEKQSRAYALRIEVAGLYTALGSAKAAMAEAVQARDELEAETVYTPVEADPRMAELYRNMEAETSALSLMQSQIAGTAVKKDQGLFSEEENTKIIELARQTIKTAFPDLIAESIFRDALAKTQTALGAYLTPEIILSLRQTQGFTADSRGLAARLVSTLDKTLELPLLDEKQKNLFLNIIVSMVVAAMQHGQTLDKSIPAIRPQPDINKKKVGKKASKKPGKKK